MQRAVTAIVLCVLAQAAIPQTDVQPQNQCVVPAASTSTVRAAGNSPAPQTAARAELIKTAAAGTRDDAPPVATAHRPRVSEQQDHPRRGGTAMLLAALALMSGIALRRYGARDA